MEAKDRRRGAPRRRKSESPAEQSREAVMTAAERCIQRHGVRKTTMDDIAREAGMSRPSIYRFFADREELLIALIEQQSRALTARTHKFLDRQPSFEDALVEGLIYLAEHGIRDPFTKFLVSPDESEFSSRLGATDAAAELTAEFWDPTLDKAEASGQMRRGLNRSHLHVWLANLGLMLMALLEKDRSAVSEYRDMIRTLVVPAFLPDAPAQNSA
jgi:AcrR family transcriptional regulator